MHRILFILFFPAVLLAQQAGKNIHYEQYTIQNGLSHNHVYQTFKDSRGIIWIITETTLNRFDGRTFKAIPQVKISERITRIYLEDQDGDLWIGDSKNTFVCFNIYTEQVAPPQQKFGSQFPSKIKGAIRGRAGAYILQTADNEISLFHPKEGIIHVYKSEKGILAPVGETEEGVLWVEDNYREKGGRFLALDAQWKEQASMPYPSDISYSYGILENRKLYYFTRDSFFVTGINGIEERSSLRTIYPGYRFENPFSTGYYHVSDANPQTREIVFFSRSYFFGFDPQFHLTYDFRRPESGLKCSQVFHIDIDEQGYIWLSTFEGLFKVWFSSNPFRQFLVTPAEEQKTAELKSCRSIVKGSDGRIYVSANNCLYDVSVRPEKALVCRPLGEGPIWAMYMDEQENLWYKDLIIRRYSIREKKEYTIPIPWRQATSWLMKRIGNRLWMGNNLAWLDVRDNSYHSLDIPDSFRELSSYSIYDIQQAGEYLWMMGESGLYRMDAETHITDRYWSGGEGVHYLPCDDFRHLYQESDSSWWFATASGLLHLNPQSHHYRLYTTADGLPHNKCHAVIPDEYGFLWVSSDNGIIQFEKSTGRMRVYYEGDGLGLNEFNRLSYYKDAEGRLYFGGINGGVSFHPQAFAKAFETSPKVQLVVTECSLSGKRSLPEKDLRAAYLTTGNIEIDPSYPLLRLRFALTDYTQPLSTLYRYRIDDSQEWEEMKNGELELAGMPYGGHTLHVSARTVNGQTAQELHIPLKVLRPFYLSSWFLVAMLLLLAGSWGVYKKWHYPAMPSERAAAQEVSVENKTTATQPVVFPLKNEDREQKMHLPKQDDIAFLEKLQSLVLQHLDDVEFDAGALGKAADLSPSQLHRRLTILTGLSVGRYIYSIRLKEAMQRIIHTKLTISEIAYQTGFSDPAYFTRLFTKMYQHPPSYFRESGR